MTQGKTVAIILAACAGFGILVIASCAGLLYVGFKNADATVSPRIDTLLSAIENDTFAETYETETTQELRDVSTKQQYTDLGKAIHVRLGALKTKSLQGFHMQQSGAGSYVDVTYTATFEKGDGTIIAKMKLQGGEWKFVSFRVDSPVFEQDIATENCATCGEPYASNASFCPSCGAKVSSGDDSDEPVQGQPPDQ